MKVEVALSMQNKLTWRSDAVKKLVCVLDERDKDAKAEGSAVRMKAQEKRTVGSPSRRQPPKYGPQLGHLCFSRY